MTDKPTKLQQIAKALMECDIEQGHATREQAEMQWGRYEVLAGVAIETLHKRGEMSAWTLKSILEGKS